jgi:hypothetical protein
LIRTALPPVPFSISGKTKDEVPFVNCAGPTRGDEPGCDGLRDGAFAASREARKF